MDTSMATGLSPPVSHGFSYELRGSGPRTAPLHLRCYPQTSARSQEHSSFSFACAQASDRRRIRPLSLISIKEEESPLLYESVAEHHSKTAADLNQPGRYARTIHRQPPDHRAAVSLNHMHPLKPAPRRPIPPRLKPDSSLQSALTVGYAPKHQVYTRPNTWSPGLFVSFQDAYFARQSPARSLQDLPSPIDSESFSIPGFQLHNPLPSLSSLKLHSLDLPVDQTRQVPLDGLLRHLGTFAAPPIQTSYATRLSADRFVAGSATRTVGGHPIPLNKRQYATWTSNYKPKSGHPHEANSRSTISASPLLHQEKKWKYPLAPPQSGPSILAPQLVLERPNSSSLQWVVKRTKTMHRIFRSRSSSKKAHVSRCHGKLRTPKYRRIEPLDSLLEAPVSALAATQTGFEYCSFEQLTAEP